MIDARGMIRQVTAPLGKQAPLVPGRRGRVCSTVPSSPSGSACHVALPRCSVLLAGLLLAWPAPVADEDEPSFNGKKLSYWIDLLEKGKDRERSAGVLGLEQIGHFGSRKVTPALVKALARGQGSGHRPPLRAVGRAWRRRWSRRGRTRRTSCRASTPSATRSRRRCARRRRRLSARPPRWHWATSGRTRGAVGALGQALKDKHPATVKAAVQSLRRIGKDARDAQADSKRCSPTRRPTRRRGTSTRPTASAVRPDVAQALPVLARSAGRRQGRHPLRKAVAEALGQARQGGGRRLPDAGGGAGRQGHASELRLAAVTALDQFGPDAKAAIPALIKAAGDPALIKSMGDNARFIRCLAMHALGRMGKELDKDRKEARRRDPQGDGRPERRGVRLGAGDARGLLRQRPGRRGGGGDQEDRRHPDARGPQVGPRGGPDGPGEDPPEEGERLSCLLESDDDPACCSAGALVLAVPLVLLAAAPKPAAQKKPLSIEDLYLFDSPRSPALPPTARPSSTSATGSAIGKVRAERFSCWSTAARQDRGA